MAPKRDSDAAEVTADAPRRSTRNKDASPPASKPASKPAASKPTSKGSKAKEAKASEAEKEENESEPAAKKAKSESSVIEIGDQVPDITLQDEDDKAMAISSLWKEKGLVVFSYPKANTPGCTTQACGFRDIYSDITDAGFEVVALSADPPKSQKSWQTKNSFQYHLLSDPKKELLKKLGATESQKRCHWVIEKGGKLLEAKIGVKPANDPSNALEFIKSLA